MSQYLEAVSREVDCRGDFFKGVSPTRLYIGGGTPSVLPPEILGEIVRKIKFQFFQNVEIEEFTIEANPNDITPDYLKFLRSIGVNRLSMGVQSFCDEHLRWFKRRHSAEGAINAYRMAVEAGFNNISLDLIFGFAHLSDSQWDNNISTILDLRPQHISCYQMSIEKGSELGRLYRKGEYSEPDQDRCANQYYHLSNRLKEAGYDHYEISNFSLPGYHSRHNSSYWQRTPYLGLGPSAHSFDGVSTRLWNPASLAKYSILTDYDQFGETLTETEIFNEQIMLGLRQSKGLKISDLDKSLYREVEGVISNLVKSGYLLQEGETIKIPPEKFFISDGIMEQCFL